MIINTNLAAQNSARNLNINQANLNKSLARLSSGSKIVQPGDDAAGFAISTRFESQIREMDAARNNIGDAISFTQTQDGYLKKVADALTRMSELAVQAQDVIKSDSDRALYQNEFSQLGQFVISSANREFNGVSLFSGANLDVTLDTDGSVLSMQGISLTSAAYSDVLSADVTSVANAQDALGKIQIAIDQLAASRAGIGAYQSRLTATADQLVVAKENLSAAQSQIQDVDMAEESTKYATQNILVQSGTAMLAQANSIPQSVLRLLQ